MNNGDNTLPMEHPPISSAHGIQPQETLIQRGAFDPPSTPGTLGHLDRFDILRLLGEGGMGQVYLAKEPLTHTQVAIKIMRPETADDPLEVHRFLTEARHMYRLSHPHILRVLEVSDRKEGPYYVMPYISGGSLLGQYKPGQPMPTERILNIARQIAEALVHAHANGLIHRDIKPGNVLLDKGGNAYLTDFGLVRTVFNDSMVDTSASHLEGTAPYMSPAVARGEAEDTRCDIYAFGALLYELLSGKPPYTGRTPQMILDQILKGLPPPIRSVNPKASLGLIKIAEGCMARELHERYATMGDVVADLDRVGKGTAPLGVYQSGLRLPRLAAWAALLLVVMAAAGALSVNALRSGRKVQGSENRTETDKAITALLEEPKDVSAWKIMPEGSGKTDESRLILTADFVNGSGGIETKTFKGIPTMGILDEMFFSATNLVRVKIAEGVTRIGDSAFFGCSNLVEVSIAGSVTIIDKKAFSKCTSLTAVYFKGDAPQLVDQNAFSQVPATLYYRPSARWWGSTFGGRPTAVWDESVNAVSQPLGAIRKPSSSLAVFSREPSSVSSQSLTPQPVAPPITGIAGIGAIIENKEGALMIETILTGGPSDKAGIKRNTKIISIAGKSTENMDVPEAVDLLRGPVGSTVKITIMPAVGTQREVELRRVTYEAPKASFRILDQTTGLIVMPGFESDSLGVAESALREFSTKGIKNVILDFRKNSCGSLRAALDVAGLFMGNETPICKYLRAGKATTETNFSTTPKVWSGELVVLVSEDTSSAAELVASACQTFKRGILLGQTTRGKGTVYMLLSQPDGGSKKVKSGEFFTANDQPLEGAGVRPDIEFTGSDEAWFAKAIECLNKR